jgi:hypothetical protein
MLSADQPPPAPPDDPEPTPGGTPPRLFFPDEPAVPAARPPVQGAPVPGAQAPGGPPGPPSPGGPEYPGYQGPARLPAPPLSSVPPRPAAPPRPPRPARPTALPRRELRQRALAASVFGLLSLFALSAANLVGHPLYLVVFAVVVALLAIVTGASARRAARREDTARPRGSVAAIVLGSVALALALILSLAIVFSRQLTAYQNCIAVARTSAAQQACAQQLRNSVDRQLDGHPN